MSGGLGVTAAGSGQIVSRVGSGRSQITAGQGERRRLSKRVVGKPGEAPGRVVSFAKTRWT